MAIHNKTVAKAAKKDIILEDTPEGSDFPFQAYWEVKTAGPQDMPENSLELRGTDASVLCDAAIFCRMMLLEHPGLSFDQTDTGEVSISFGHRVIGTVAELDDIAQATNEALDELSDEERALGAQLDAEDEEVLRGGSVVPDKYKKQYAADGHPGNCGDWLALTLEPLVTNQASKFDPDAMDEIARLNNIDTSKLNRDSRGWQGRFRMTTRNMMVKVVAKSGVLHVPASEKGDTVAAPTDWIARNQPKPKEVGAKKAKKGEAG